MALLHEVLGLDCEVWNWRMVWDLSFEMWVLGMREKGLEYNIHSPSEVWGLEFEVWDWGVGLGFRV